MSGPSVCYLTCYCCGWSLLDETTKRVSRRAILVSSYARGDRDCEQHEWGLQWAVSHVGRQTEGADVQYWCRATRTTSETKIDSQRAADRLGEQACGRNVDMNGSPLTNLGQSTRRGGHFFFVLVFVFFFFFLKITFVGFVFLN